MCLHQTSEASHNLSPLEASRDISHHCYQCHQHHASFLPGAVPWLRFMTGDVFCVRCGLWLGVDLQPVSKPPSIYGCLYQDCYQPVCVCVSVCECE